MTIAELPRLAVFHDVGSSSILQIIKAADGWCRLVWIVGWSSDPPPLQELSRFGEVIDLTSLEAPHQVERVVAANPDGVAVFHDGPLMLAAAVAERLGLPFHSQASAQLLTDKVAQRIALRDAGLPVPKFAVVRFGDSEADVPFPAVLKPRVGAGSRDTFKVADRREVASTLALCDVDEEFILEEWWPDKRANQITRADQVSVESIARDGVLSTLW